MRLAMRCRVIPVGGLVALLLFSAAAPVLANPEEARLQETRQELEEVRGQLEQARGARDAEAEALAIAQARVDDVLAAVGEAQLAVERQRAAVAAERERLDGLVAQAEGRTEATGERVRAIYQQGGDASLGAMLSGDSLGQALGRGVLLDVIARSDQEVFEAIAADAVAIDAQRERLEQEQAALERVLAEEQALLAEVEEIRADQAMVLAEADAQVGELANHEAYLAEEEREIAAAARRAAEEAEAAQREQQSGSSGGSEPAPAPPPPSGGGGGWGWPSGGVVTSEYGPRWGRLHAGIDIGAGHGSPVVASRPGTVSMTGWMGGYGQTVMVSHGGGYVTLYAHLSSIAVSRGQQVSQGQTLGGMGCTGSCTGTHVHFEIREHGTARNPRQFLP